MSGSKKEEESFGKTKWNENDDTNLKVVLWTDECEKTWFDTHYIERKYLLSFKRMNIMNYYNSQYNYQIK